nr:MAG: hypothetical protein AM325_02610 [Candidatus Thorarchaeota archaeon SMTZ1-45]
MKEKLRERLPIIEWPDIERRMAIISRMTSEPPAKTQKKESPELVERTDIPSPFSGESSEIERKI